MKRLIVFGLDGTLAESRTPLDAEMGTLLGALLNIVRVAVISDGDRPQFDKQILPNLSPRDHLGNVSITGRLDGLRCTDPGPKGNR